MFNRILLTDSSKSTILIRLMVGSIFFSEGLQKFLFSAERGTGFFLSLGFENADTIASLVGGFEVICGTLILLGLYTRFAAVMLFTIMFMALSTTKIPMLSHTGFWEVAHAARTEFAMLLASLFLLCNGGGKWSTDRFMLRKYFNYRF